MLTLSIAVLVLVIMVANLYLQNRAIQKNVTDIYRRLLTLSDISFNIVEADQGLIKKIITVTTLVTEINDNLNTRINLLEDATAKSVLFLKDANIRVNESLVDLEDAVDHLKEDIERP